MSAECERCGADLDVNLECPECPNALKLHALHYLMSWNYSFSLATGKAEHGTINDFWEYVLDDYRNDKIPEPRYLKVHGPESELSYARLHSLERENEKHGGTDSQRDHSIVA